MQTNLLKDKKMSNQEKLEHKAEGGKIWWIIATIFTAIATVGFILWLTFLSQNFDIVITKQVEQNQYLERFDSSFTLDKNDRILLLENQDKELKRDSLSLMNDSLIIEILKEIKKANKEKR
jgi:hypothetical protein